MRPLPTKILLTFLCICFAGDLSAAPTVPTDDAPKHLTILADPSLALPLSLLSRDYTRDKHIATTVVMLSGQDVAEQIAQGLEANLIVTADKHVREALSTQGLIDVYNRQDIASTQLALVAPADAVGRSNLATHISFAAILYAQPELPIYVSQPNTLEGARAKQLMHNADYSPPLVQRTVTLENHAQVMQQLRLHPGFALMLATDAFREPGLKVLAVLPTDVVDNVQYEAVRVAGADSDSTRDFLEYLRSAQAQSALQHFGFQAPQEN